MSDWFLPTEQIWQSYKPLMNCTKHGFGGSLVQGLWILTVNWYYSTQLICIPKAKSQKDFHGQNHITQMSLVIYPTKGEKNKNFDGNREKITILEITEWYKGYMSLNSHV